MTPAHRWLDARVERVEAECKLRARQARRDGPLFDVLLRVEEKLTDEARAREERALAAMARSAEDRWELGGGITIERIERRHL